MKHNTYQLELTQAVTQVDNGDGYDLTSKTLRKLLNRGYIEPHGGSYRTTAAGRRFARIAKAA